MIMMMFKLKQDHFKKRKWARLKSEWYNYKTKIMSVDCYVEVELDGKTTVCTKWTTNTVKVPKQHGSGENLQSWAIVPKYGLWLCSFLFQLQADWSCSCDFTVCYRSIWWQVPQQIGYCTLFILYQFMSVPSNYNCINYNETTCTILVMESMGILECGSSILESALNLS